MQENHGALIVWLKTSPDPFGNIALNPSVLIASINALLKICPDRKTERLAHKALNAAKLFPQSTEQSVEIAYQLVRISVSGAVR